MANRYQQLVDATHSLRTTYRRQEAILQRLSKARERYADNPAVMAELDFLLPAAPLASELAEAKQAQTRCENALARWEGKSDEVEV